MEEGSEGKLYGFSKRISGSQLEAEEGGCAVYEFDEGVGVCCSGTGGRVEVGGGGGSGGPVLDECCCCEEGR